MDTEKIVNGLDKKELLKWKAELKSILDESNWQLVKAERALSLYQSALQECTQKLESEKKRATETRTAMQFLSQTHPLRNKCEDDLYRTEIRIFRLENKLKRCSILKPIQLEMKKLVLAGEIEYYKGVLTEVENLLHPLEVLKKVLDTPDGETTGNPLPEDGKIFILKPKRERMDFFSIPQLKQGVMDGLNVVRLSKQHNIKNPVVMTELREDLYG